MKHLIKKLLREGLLSEISEEAYELLKTKYKDSRVIMSKEEKITFRNNPKQTPHHKPKGLWYGIGTSWVDWIRSEQPDWEEDYTHIVDVDLSKIKVIRSYDELLKFSDEYSIGDKPTGGLIDWAKVASKYSGIEIVPYIFKARFDLLWYYSWDVASGCIWDSNAIKSIKNLGDKKQDYKVLYGLPERAHLDWSGFIDLTNDVSFAEYANEERGNNVIVKYKLPNNLNILNIENQAMFKSLTDEFGSDIDYEEFAYQPNKDFVDFLTSKGYSGFSRDGEFFIFDKNKVEQI